MRTIRFIALTLALMLGGTTLCPAQSLTPKPLNTDPNLAALIAVRGRFESLIVDEQRNLTLRVWAADFSPNETVDFDELLSRSFSELELPEEAGWGLFEPVNNSLEIRVRVTDRLGRLGRVEFRSWETGQLLSSIWANSWRTEVSGVFSIPSDLREMVAVVQSDTGGVLARMAVHVGNFDKVVPIVLTGFFTPYYPEPVYCAHFGEQPGDAYGLRSGNPYDATDVKNLITGVGRSRTTVYQDFTNDSQSIGVVEPPPYFWGLWRKKTILNTVVWGWHKVADPESMTRLVAAVTAAALEDTSHAVSVVQALPYSEGCARWRVGFTGRVTSVLVIPYERRKRNVSLAAFVGALPSVFVPQRGFLSVLLANLANEWLRERQNRDATGLIPGDVQPWGDVYAVETESWNTMPRLVNTTQQWTVYLRVRYLDASGRILAEQPASGLVDIMRATPVTNPAPPSEPTPIQIYVSGAQGAKVPLGKGWWWKLKPSAPGGQERLVQSPAIDPSVTLYIHITGIPPGEPPGEQ